MNIFRKIIMENSGRQLNKCQHRTNCISFLLNNNISLAREAFPTKLPTGINVKGEKSIVRFHFGIYVQALYRYLRFMVVFAMIFGNCLNFADCARVFSYGQKTDQAQLITNGDFYSMNGKLDIPSILSTHLHRQARNTDTSIHITGVRVEDGSFESADGVPSVLSDAIQKIRVFGTGLNQNSVIAFTTTANPEGGPCLKPDTDLFRPDAISKDGFTAEFSVKFPKPANTYYICSKNDQEIDGKSASATKPLEHQGDRTWTKIQTYEPLLPTWAAITIILCCLCFSALFSGLNLGLMALDRTELKILRNTGSQTERKYAAKIQPVRDQGNYLLCSILLGNVLVNSTFTILLDGLTSGLVAVVCSTLAIVLFGEITPQAICSRHGLAIGAKTIYITKTVMAITAPLSYPVSRILDAILGEEIGNVYNRERLKELVRVTTGINDLDKTEVNIISGALELRKKTVADIMTHIDDAFMLSLESVLDFETVSEIMKSGYSRIPVYDGDRKNIVTLLYIKDLAFVDTDDNTPLKTLCEFYQNPVHFVFEDYTLDVMFNQFKDGTIGHLAFVHRVNNEGDGDPFYETVGLVTLEDVIEELIQAEIVDEFDVFIDNRTKIKRNRRKQDFTSFAERREAQTIRVSPQLALATFQYLSTAVDAFKPDVISENILRRLLNQDVFHNIKSKGKTKDDPSLFIFQQGKAVDFFVLILEGRVEVTIGKEALMFESGPFTYFGTQALVPNVVIESPTQLHGSMQSLNMDSKIRQTFVPDYSVRATSDVIYITIRRNLYLTAKKATLLEKSRKSGTFQSEALEDEEVERLLNSITDDEKPRLVAATQSFRQISKSPKSTTSDPSIDHVSEDGNKHLKGNREDVSVNSFATSEIPVDLPNGEQEENSAVSLPLLPKPRDDREQKHHSSQQ